MALTVSVDEIIRGSRNPLLGARPHWKRIRLGDIASALNGFAFKSAQFTKGHGMPLIRIRDVGGDSTDTNYVGEFDDRYVVKSGDLLVGMDGDFNCARWRGPLGLLNQRVCKVTLQSDQYHPRFLDFSLPGYLKAINDATSSVTVKHLSSRTIEDIPLPFPSLHEQEEIVAELEKQFSRLDEAVANLKRVNANVSRYKDAVLTAAVQGKLVWKTAVDSDQGHDLLARIRQSRKAAWIEHGGGRSTRPYRAPPNADEALRFEIPNHWAIATVDELTPADRACAYGVLQPGDDTADGVPFIRVGDVHDGVVDIDTLKRIQPSIAAQYPRTQLEGGEILITIVGTIGRTAVVPRSLNGANVARAIGVIPLTAMVNPWWVSLWFESPAVRLRMTSAAHEVARKTLNLEDVRRAPVAIPPLNEQDQIVQAADQALSLVGKTREELNLALIRARRLRDAVLAAAFSSSPTSRT